MKMQNAELDFVRFDSYDVITTSGPLSVPKYIQINNLYDKRKNNAGVSYRLGESGGFSQIYDARDYQNDERKRLNALISSLNTNIGTDKITLNTYFTVGEDSRMLTTLFGETSGDNDSTDYSGGNAFNTIFEWIESNGQFVAH